MGAECELPLPTFLLGFTWNKLEIDMAYRGIGVVERDLPGGSVMRGENPVRIGPAGKARMGVRGGRKSPQRAARGTQRP